MDFLDPKKKKAHLLRLYIGYFLVGTALIIGTLILVFAAYGYDIDRKTGDIIQNGLVVIDAHPESAAISVNGQNRGNTDSRLVLPAGQYNIELSRDGYQTWKHTINLGGSSIEQLAYPFLFPSKLVTTNIQTYSITPELASESPDRHWLVVHQPTTPSTFQVIDLSTDKHPVTTLALPSDTFTTAAGVHQYEALEWSTDNTHLLLKHTFESGVEFIMLDRNAPENSINLSKVFAGQTFTDMNLHDKKSDQFYLYDATSGNIYQADTKSRLVTIIADHVLSFKPYKSNTLLYAKQKTAADSSTIDVYVRQGEKNYLLRELPKSDKYLLDMAEFSGNTYVAVGSQGDGKTYLYRDPLNDLTRKPAATPQPFRALVVPGAYNISFSAIARFIMIQNGSRFAVYDAETGRQFRYDTKLTVAANQKATWMDGHRLLLVSDSKVVVFDFDGLNQQTLSPALPAFTPFFDRDYTAMFTLASDTGQNSTFVTRTELKVLPENKNN